MSVEQRQVRRYGWRPSLPDPRDHVADTSQIKILDEVDPREQISSQLGIYDQGQLGSCTANATCRAVQIDAMYDGQKIAPSRLATYWGERFLEHQPADQDTGAMGRDGFKWMRQVGWWDEGEIPYSDSTLNPGFFHDPRQKGKATGRLAKTYKAVPQTQQAVKAVLSNRQTIAFGFSVFESFESQQVATTGVMPVPNTQAERLLGGHEVVAVGYLASDPDHVLCENSWSDGWGLSGYFLMPWAVFLDAQMVSDLRTIRRPIGQ